jgi:hypothetical protein
MANDREVLREIWEGRLPVCFQLNSEEVYSLQAPDPYYLMVPRLSYFPLVTDKVRKTYQNLEVSMLSAPLLFYRYKIGLSSMAYPTYEKYTKFFM